MCQSGKKDHQDLRDTQVADSQQSPNLFMYRHDSIERFKEQISEDNFKEMAGERVSDRERYWLTASLGRGVVLEHRHGQ